MSGNSGDSSTGPEIGIESSTSYSQKVHGVNKRMEASISNYQNQVMANMDRDTYMNDSMIGEIRKLSPGLEMGEPGKTCLICKCFRVFTVFPHIVSFNPHNTLW